MDLCLITVVFLLFSSLLVRVSLSSRRPLVFDVQLPMLF